MDVRVLILAVNILLVETFSSSSLSLLASPMDNPMDSLIGNPLDKQTSGETTTTPVPNITHMDFAALGQGIPGEFDAQWSQALASNEQKRLDAQAGLADSLRSRSARTRFAAAVEQLGQVVAQRNQFYPGFVRSRNLVFAELQRQSVAATQAPDANSLPVLSALRGVFGQWVNDFTEHVVDNSRVYADALTSALISDGNRYRGDRDDSGASCADSEDEEEAAAELAAASLSLRQTLADQDVQLLSLLTVAQNEVLNGYLVRACAIVLQGVPSPDGAVPACYT